MINDGLEPRINISIRSLKISEKKFIILFRINKGWNGPHRVIFDRHDKFYSRKSASKYRLDTSELRTAFTLTQTFQNKIENFRAERISRLALDDTPVPLRSQQKIILHLIPLGAFTPGFSINEFKCTKTSRFLARSP